MSVSSGDKIRQFVEGHPVRIIWITFALLIALLIIVLIWHSDDAEGAEARLVDFGPQWNSIVNCESRGDPEAYNASSGASGLFQFLPSTWRWTAEAHNREKLGRKAPSSQNIAIQFRQAIRLQTMPGGGYAHWVCSIAGDSRPVLITETSPIRNPQRCFNSLSKMAPKKVSRSVCGWTRSNKN